MQVQITVKKLEYPLIVKWWRRRWRGWDLRQCDIVISAPHKLRKVTGQEDAIESSVAV